MQDDELRALIRESIARHLGQSALIDGRAGCLGAEAGAEAAPNPALATHGPAWKSHSSHGRFVFLAPTEPDAPCIVEPHVRCTHCGFCQSYGH
jgi:hypothetical protein